MQFFNFELGKQFLNQKCNPMLQANVKIIAELKGLVKHVFSNRDYLYRPEALPILEMLRSVFLIDPVPVRNGRSFKRKRKNAQTRSKYKTYTNFKAAY